MAFFRRNRRPTFDSLNYFTRQALLRRRGNHCFYSFFFFPTTARSSLIGRNFLVHLWRTKRPHGNSTRASAAVSSTSDSRPPTHPKVDSYPADSTTRQHGCPARGLSCLQRGQRQQQQQRQQKIFFSANNVAIIAAGSPKRLLPVSLSLWSQPRPKVTAAPPTVQACVAGEFSNKDVAETVLLYCIPQPRRVAAHVAFSTLR